MIKLLTPENGEILDQLTQAQKDCLKYTGTTGPVDFDWRNPERKGEDLSAPNPLTFIWEAKGPAVLFISPYGDFSECSTYVGNNKAEVYHLLIGKK